MEQASKHISAFVSIVSVSQNYQDRERDTVTMTIRQKVADPSDKRRSNMQLIRQKRQSNHTVLSGVVPEVICHIPRTSYTISISLAVVESSCILRLLGLYHLKCRRKVHPHDQKKVHPWLNQEWKLRVCVRKNLKNNAILSPLHC